MRSGIDKKMLTILVLFDFSKAFDCVNHSLLLQKLRNLNFSCTSLNWFHSYLNGRRQSVKDSNGNLSEWASISSGVPQGSVLGPLLFSLYVRDLSVCIQKCKYMMYADDLQIYIHCHSHDFPETIRLINDDVSAIVTWAHDNFLKINSNKTKAMIIGHSRVISRLNTNNLPKIEVQGISIPYSTTAKNLGVIFSDTLSWKHHISLVSNKVNATLHQLKLHKNLFPTHVRSQLVSSLIFPHFDYCCLVFYDLTAELNIKLQRLMNSSIRFIYNLQRDEHITPYINKLSWMDIKTRRKFKLACFMYSLLKINEPQYIIDLFPKRTIMPNVVTRAEADYIHVSHYRTTAFHRSFTVAASQIWNNLPKPIKDSTSLKVFRKKLYPFLNSPD